MFLIFMFLNKYDESTKKLIFLCYNSFLNINNKYFFIFLFNFNFNFFFNNYFENYKFFIKYPIIKKLKKFNNYKNFFYINRLSFSFNFIFNKLFKINIIKKHFNDKKLTNELIIKNKYKLLLKNWSYTVSNAISPYFWDLSPKKKWIRKNLNFRLLRNFKFFFSDKYHLKINDVNKNKYMKKYFYHNFYYLTKLNLNYSNLNLVIKTKYNRRLKNTKDWFLYKPHINLRTFYGFKFSNRYNNYRITRLFKSYSRIFRSFKRFNYSFKKKKTINSIFKNTFSKKLAFNKNRTAKIYKPNFNMKNNISIFLFKPYSIIKTNIKKIKWKKKKFRKFRKISLINWWYSVKEKSKISNKTKLFKKLQKKYILKHKYLQLKKKHRFGWKLRKLHTSSSCIQKRFTTKKFLKQFKFCKSYIFKNKNKKIELKKIELKFFKKSNFLINPSHTLFFNKIFKKIIKKKSYHLPKTIFKNRYKMNFLTNNYGFLFLNNFQINHLKVFTNFNNLKQYLYSFSYKNELKKFVLRRYSRFNKYFSNFFNNTKKFKNTRTHLNLQSIPKSQSILNNFFSYKNNLTLINESNYFSNKNWTRYNQNLSYWKNDDDEHSEFNIKRIRFKPGYMKIWREARNSLQTTLALNFKYQHRITKYLSRFHKFIKFKTFLIREMTLTNILIKSRIITETSIINFLIKNNLIYINGMLTNNNTQQIFVGDFIQLTLNLKYYIIFKWLFNLSIKKINRLKKLSKKKYSRFSSLNDKKKSYNLPKWILFSKNSYDDVPKFLEIDYFTLSIFVIYEPFLWSDLNVYNIIDNKFSIINIYNWKYIN